MEIKRIEDLRNFAKKHNFKLIYKTMNCPCDFVIFLYDIEKSCSIRYDGYYEPSYPHNFKECIENCITYIKLARNI